MFWDGQGFCLYYKVLEKGRFPWPSATGWHSPADGGAVIDVLWEVSTGGVLLGHLRRRSGVG
ncbi:transposase [Sinorhizobium meliloti]|uniref:transposase n=1 Tax=Rhizobium meliloti TaxID=382 RepID=UPI001F3E1F3F|nr:transposase [Sinorhizobium meliloti]